VCPVENLDEQSSIIGVVCLNLKEYHLGGPVCCRVFQVKGCCMHAKFFWFLRSVMYACWVLWSCMHADGPGVTPWNSKKKVILNNWPHSFNHCAHLFKYTVLWSFDPTVSFPFECPICTELKKLSLKCLMALVSFKMKICTWTKIFS